MEIEEFTPGRFCWHEISTTDDRKAKAFYEGLFGWTIAPSDLTEGAPESGESGMTYWKIRQDGKEIGGAYRMMPQMLEQGVPPHWLSYVGVTSADDTTARATELGGTVVMGPMDVLDIGRMSLLHDPTGAMFALWQPKRHRGHGVSGEVGAVCWNELLTNDVERATAFYSKLFGWKPAVQQMGPTRYTMMMRETTRGMMRGEEPACGIMEIPREAGPECPSNWMVYFQVGDTEEQVARAIELGGDQSGEIHDVPRIGRMAVLTDSTGAYFAVIRLNQE